MAAWALALWAVLVLVRAQVMGYGWYWLSRPLEQGPMVLAGAYLDFIYVGGIGAAFAAVMWLSRRRRRVLRALHIALGTVAALSMLAAILNIDVVQMIGHPLNWPWLYYSGFLRGFDAQQAILASLTRPLVIGIVAAITSLILLTQALRWGITRIPMPWWAPIAVAGSLIAYPVWASSYVGDFYRPALQNPVVVFAASVVSRADTKLFEMSTAVDSDDFRTAAEARAAGEDLSVRPDSRVRNVLVIVLESVAAEYLPAYGAPWPVTPNLDRHLDHSRIFTSIYSHAPNTNKAMVSLLCSMYPWPTYRFITREHADAPLVALPDVLADKGYRTGLFYAADLRFGNARGFLENHRLDAIRDLKDLSPPKVFASNEKQPFLDSADDTSLVNSVMQWLGEQPEKPFAAVVWTGQTHYPYYTTRPLASLSPGRELLNRYLNAMVETDQAVGQLLDWMESRDLLDSTLVIVVGDHGEAFGQHNQFGHSNKLYEDEHVVGAQYGHGSRLFEENVRVPLMMIHPMFSRSTDATVGGIVDIAPTILGLLGDPLPDDWQGRSLLTTQRPDRTYFIAPWSGMTVGYREGDTKHIYDAMADTHQVYDLAADPREQHDLSAGLAEPQRLAVRERLAAWLQYQARLVADLAGESGAPREESGRGL